MFLLKPFKRQLRRELSLFIDLEVEGDTQFPDYQSVATWENVDEQANKPDEKNQYSYKFVTLYKKD